MFSRLFFVAAFIFLSAAGAFADDTLSPWGDRLETARHPVASERAWRAEASQGGVQQMIAHYVARELGSQWVGPALRIAKLESGYRCNARNRSAVGLFQNTNPAMFGVSRAQALTCQGGLVAGVAHMKMCLHKGAHDLHSMMRCHNSGSPYGRVDRNYRIAMRG